MNLENTVFGYLYRRIPNYYPEMYKEGFKPWEILYAHQRMMLRDAEERMLENDSHQTESDNIFLKGDIYVNGKKV